MWDMQLGRGRVTFLNMVDGLDENGKLGRWSNISWESLPGFSAGEKTKIVANRVYYFLRNTTTFITYGPVSPGIGSVSEERMAYPHTFDPDNRLYGDRIWIDPPLLQPLARLMIKG
ncbi:hypothetical protein CK203_084993 [Vitis vinifera]|uniref:Uncharacterized protein n=1 Tax=Vitis vinifera TaxID=29760 RepID=A0A438F183_VITVI|nr:hypothetical protein CK203_084993 [Vitis vinifera]